MRRSWVAIRMVLDVDLGPSFQIKTMNRHPGVSTAAHQASPVRRVDYETSTDHSNEPCQKSILPARDLYAKIKTLTARLPAVACH